MKSFLFCVGALGAIAVLIVAWSNLNVPLPQILKPERVAIAQRTLLQTFTELEPHGGGAMGDLIAVSSVSLPLELLTRPTPICIFFLSKIYHSKV